MELNQIFEYKDGILFWKRPFFTRLKGLPAGHVNHHGYHQIQLNGKRYATHRLVWEMFNGPIPKGFEVDHIDRVLTNNRIENLRLASRKNNSYNRKPSSKFSKYKGVNYSNQSTGKYRANIKFNGKKIHLGTFKTAQEAAVAYDNAALKYFDEFACTNQSLYPEDFSPNQKE